MPETALVEVASTPVPAPTASERKGLAQIIVSEWYWIAIAVLVLLMLGGLVERIAGLFTAVVPGYGAVWQRLTTPTTPAPPSANTATQ